MNPFKVKVAPELQAIVYSFLAYESSKRMQVSYAIAVINSLQAAVS